MSRKHAILFKTLFLIFGIKLLFYVDIYFFSPENINENIEFFIDFKMFLKILRRWRKIN